VVPAPAEIRNIKAGECAYCDGFGDRNRGGVMRAILGMVDRGSDTAVPTR